MNGVMSSLVGAALRRGDGARLGAAAAAVAVAALFALLALTAPASSAATRTPRLYWSSGTEILRSALNGSGTTKLITLSARRPQSTFFVNDLAVGSRYVFWANDRGGIGRMTLSGASARLIIHAGSFVFSLFFQQKRLYWLTRRGLYSAGPAGGNPHVVVSAQTLKASSLNNVNGPDLVAISSDRLIWDVQTLISPPDAVQDRYRTDLVATNLDGTNPHLLGSLPTDHQDITAIAVNGSTVFWARLDHHRIYSANLDGSNVRVLANVGRLHPFRLAIGGGRLFWLAQNNGFNVAIGSARLGGSGIRVVHRLPGKSGKPGATALAISP